MDYYWFFKTRLQITYCTWVSALFDVDWNFIKTNYCPGNCWKLILKVPKHFQLWPHFNYHCLNKVRSFLPLFRFFVHNCKINQGFFTLLYNKYNSIMNTWNLLVVTNKIDWISKWLIIILEILHLFIKNKGKKNKKMYILIKMKIDQLD